MGVIGSKSVRRRRDEAVALDIKQKIATFLPDELELILATPRPFDNLYPAKQLKKFLKAPLANHQCFLLGEYQLSGEYFT
ncbi:hypothetical protein DP113_00920 [Brasilonema octagenarum UFV-E1]|uniref:Uncharacterized protein n=1 Tax=Brasilonema sennae CENA114 TaxID=415709 RepID=A0A856M7F4_9CYAN|nr:hypothetical protein [Brasilonema sennae]QDL06662.1 hypothetical protein DP114_00930 [Brasilonema sennae CENA114]QDL13030.1 hypothetical protein DP113_00920 [Brasilonema octagenarum UFV-E1]